MLKRLRGIFRRGPEAPPPAHFSTTICCPDCQHPYPVLFTEPGKEATVVCNCGCQFDLCWEPNSVSVRGR